MSTKDRNTSSWLNRWMRWTNHVPKTRAVCRRHTLAVCVGFGKKTRIWENVVLQAQITVSSDFLLFKLLRLTSSCAPVIMTTTTRGRCPATNIDTGRNKMSSQLNGRFSNEDRLSVFLFLVLLCYQNCQISIKIKRRRRMSASLLCYRHLNGGSSRHIGTRFVSTKKTALFSFSFFFDPFNSLHALTEHLPGFWSAADLFMFSLPLKKKEEKKNRHHQDLELLKSLKNINHDILKTRKWVAVCRRCALTVPPMWAERGGRAKRCVCVVRTHKDAHHQCVRLSG